MCAWNTVDVAVNDEDFEILASVAERLPTAMLLVEMYPDSPICWKKSRHRQPWKPNVERRRMLSNVGKTNLPSPGQLHCSKTLVIRMVTQKLMSRVMNWLVLNLMMNYLWEMGNLTCLGDNIVLIGRSMLSESQSTHWRWCRRNGAAVGTQGPPCWSHGHTRRILQRFYWPSLFKDVVDYCKCCPECQKCSTRKESRAPLVPLPPVEEPFKRIAVDIGGPLPHSRSGNQYILVICDYATRYLEAVPLSRTDAQHIIELVKLFS